MFCTFFKRRRRTVFTSVALALPLFLALPAAAENPPGFAASGLSPLPAQPATAHPYLILARGHRRCGVVPAAPAPAALQPVAKTPYRYGWFGVPPRRHGVCSQSYYGEKTILTYR